MQVKLSKFAFLLFGLTVLLALIVFSANKWDLQDEVVLYGICVAVAVISESLIAVMAITIAVGVKAMAQGNVVIRRMAALEAIGGVTNICSDKTGTLTQGKMLAHKVWVPDLGILSIKDVTNILDPGDGRLEINDEPFDKFEVSSQAIISLLRAVLDAAALCNFASVFRSNTAAEESFEKQPSSREWNAIGDPRKIALQVLAMRFNRRKDTLLQDASLMPVMEHQFGSTLERMSVAYKRKDTENVEVFVKGASEAIILILKISEKEEAELSPVLNELASDVLRVLCIATKFISGNEERNLSHRNFMESRLELQGLIGIYDPPRAETFDAVKICHEAGIAVHMLTGDHLSTATAIAEKVGILKPDQRTSQSVMRAQDFDKLSDAEIDSMKSLPLVLARCSPTTKVKIVDALSRRQAFCVMTGDGVNDAPALKRAHVGISMGINGTNVAKDAFDMVLTDDNFASIVRSVEEGRRLFDNIQKVILPVAIFD